MAQWLFQYAIMEIGVCFREVNRHEGQLTRLTPTLLLQCYLSFSQRQLQAPK